MAGTVTVACRIPMGIILREFRVADEREQTPNGVREIKVGRATGKSVVINGVATEPRKQRFDRFGVPVTMTRGYALTPNVDADLWENWLSYHKDHPMVVNRMIFATAKPADADAIARENEARASGLEPMLPDNDPRAPARRTTLASGRSLSSVVTASREAA